MIDYFTITNIPVEYQYIISFTAILLLPKLLVRFRIPVGITALFLGALCTNFLGWFDQDQLIITLSRLGITSLFLFAGMEIDVDQLKKNIKPLLWYISQSLSLIFGCAVGVYYLAGLSFQISLILSIAIFTPSAGFILSSLKHYELNDEEIFWIKLKAISKEVAAIIVLFIALQLNDLETLFKVKGILILLFLALPQLFKFYLRFIVPYATKSEVSFLVIIAFLTGVLTKKLGTHYLVGAFATGIIAGGYKHFIDSEHSHRIENSLAAFYGIFVPFYFFSAGLLLTKEFFGLQGLLYGLGICAVFIPLRVFTTVFHIKYFMKDFWQDRMKISISLAPNLIFGLVVISILRERFGVDPTILSGIVIYTVVASILPAIYFDRVPPEDYDLSRIRAPKPKA